MKLFLFLAGVILNLAQGMPVGVDNIASPRPNAWRTSLASFRGNYSFSSDGRYFATFRNESVQLIDLHTGAEKIIDFPRHPMLFNSLEQLKFRPQTHEIFFVGGVGSRRIEIPSSGVGEAYSTPLRFEDSPMDLGVTQLVFSTNGKYVAVGHSKQHPLKSNVHGPVLTVFDAVSGLRMLEIAGTISECVFSADGRSLLYFTAGDQLVSRQFVTKQGNPISRTTVLADGTSMSNFVQTVGQSPFIASMNSSQLNIFPEGKPSKIRLRPSKDFRFSSAAVSDSGRIAFSETNEDGQQNVLVSQLAGGRARSRTPLSIQSKGKITSLVLSPNGTTLLIGTNLQEFETVSLDQAENGRVVQISELYELDPRAVSARFVDGDRQSDTFVRLSPDAEHILFSVPSHRTLILIKTPSSTRACPQKLEDATVPPSPLLLGSNESVF